MSFNSFFGEMYVKKKIILFSIFIFFKTFALIEAPSTIYVGNGMNSLGAYNYEYYDFFSDSSGINYHKYR